CTGAVLAQENSPAATLKTQIIQLENIARSADSSPTAKASSLRLLTEKRMQLRASLKMQIDSLHRYQASYGYRLSAKENQRVTDSIRNLSSELQSLGGTPGLEAGTVVQEKGHAEKPARGFA